MRTLEQWEGVLEARMAHVQPDLRPPASLLRRLVEALAGEDVLLLSSDLRSLGFGAYAGQLCVVTRSRVLLATGMPTQGADTPFAIEQWERQAGPMPALHCLQPRAALEQ